jgi:uncharacterized protein YndB with AHSA1/START domain
MSTQTAPNISLKVSRLIKAPIARVFAAWTTPEQVRQWLGGACANMASVKIDPRIGGDYCFNMVKPQGEMAMRGTYREVSPPTRLVFTWMAGSCSGAQDTYETLVTVDLAEVQGGTEVTITHERFTSDESREQHNNGWTASLDCLEKVMAGIKTK